ncbi:MAG TPA: NfeD family protein, partial [Terriglobia bacterium]
MKVWVRYFSLQVPGWVLTAILVGGLHHWEVLSLWTAVAVWLIYVAKDFALYPFLRRAYDPEAKTGAATLIGSLGVAKRPLQPEGYVQVHGDLWQACAEPRDRAIAAGARVRVVAASGLTLFVCEDSSSGEKSTSAGRD